MLTSKDQSILKSNLNPSLHHLTALPVFAEKYIMKKICMQKWSICFGSRKKVPHWKPSTEHSDNHHSHPENKVWQKNLFILTLKHSTWFMNYTQCQITLTRPPSSISNLDKYLQQRLRGQPNHGAAVMSFHKHCLKGKKINKSRDRCMAVLNLHHKDNLELRNDYLWIYSCHWMQIKAVSQHPSYDWKEMTDLGFLHRGLSSAVKSPSPHPW